MMLLLIDVGVLEWMNVEERDEEEEEMCARVEGWTRAEAASATTAFAEWIERGCECV